MAGDIYVARKTAALVFAGKTVFIEEGTTMAREGHPILNAAGEMFAPLVIHFEVDPDADGQEDGAAPAADSTPAPKDVRAWAAQQGIEVPARGKIPAEVNEQYVAAHQEA